MAKQVLLISGVDVIILFICHFMKKLSNFFLKISCFKHVVFINLSYFLQMILTLCFSRATTAGRKTNAHPSPSTPCSCVPVRRLHKGKLSQCLGALIYSIVFCRCSVCFGPLKLIVFYSLLLAIDLQPRPQIYRNGVA